MVVDHGDILAIAFVDNTAVALCTSKGLVCVWDILTGRDIRFWQCEESTDGVRCAAFGSDGTLIATSGLQMEHVYVWSTTTGKRTLALACPWSTVTGIAFSSNGRLAAASESPLTIRFWDGRTGLSIGDPVVVEDSMIDIKFSSLAISSDGTVVAVGLAIGKIEVYDLNTQTRASFSVSPFFATKSIALSPDGFHLALVEIDTIRFCDWRTKHECATPLRGHTGYISFISYSPDGAHIVSASDDHTIRIWDVESNTVVPQPLQHSFEVDYIALSSNSTIVVSCPRYGFVQVWDTQNGQQKLQIQLGIERTVSSVAISPNGRLIASASHPHPPRALNPYYLGTSVIRFWNAQTGDPVESMLECSSGVVREMVFLPDMSQLISASVLKTSTDET